MLQLSGMEQQRLLQIARNSVRAYLSGETVRLSKMATGILSESHGVFVSIHKNRELRGCIGSIQTPAPLYRTTSECAISSAVGDPRFVPLAMRELDDVVFEVSVLSPIERVEEIDEIEIGKHGVLICKNQVRGLLLPQVPVAYGWNRERFLAETCRKAGLKPADWEVGALIYRFSAFVFSERNFLLGSAS